MPQPMRIAIPRERHAAEKRVAATPETVKKLRALGYEVMVETGAGITASYADAAYQQTGATIVPSLAALYSNAQLILKVQRPLSAFDPGDGMEELGMLQPGTTLVGMLSPHGNQAAVRLLAERRIDALSLDLLPRISRAQTMDALSSQASLAGYKAVLDAAGAYGRALPLMMTAAGTIPPARVLVMGIGVAGLQAIATAKRLGAQVSATDIRPETAEQAQSLGASFIAPDAVAGVFAKQDIIIATAQSIGRAAPRLIARAMVESLRAGSVIVDLSIEQGGNCELSRPGEVFETPTGVTIIGHINMPSRLAADASALYARNLYNLIATFTRDGVFTPDQGDPLIAAMLLTHNGKIVNEAC